jgi:hypothetical protein
VPSQIRRRPELELPEAAFLFLKVAQQDPAKIAMIKAVTSMFARSRTAPGSKVSTDPEGEASLRGHLKAEGAEESGSQSYVPPEEKDERALKEALDLLRGTIADRAFPPNPKAAVP